MFFKVFNGSEGASSCHLGPCWDHVRTMLELIWAKLGYAERMLIYVGHVGGILGHLGASVERFGIVLGPS